MKELKEIIAKNLQDLRAKKRITQYQLAQALNYSDKAVSKWERAESIPDVTVIKQIADFFGVTVDYLLTEEHDAHLERVVSVSTTVKHNRFIISALSVSLVWCIAVFMFIILRLPASAGNYPYWLIFIYAAPLSMITVLVFNSVWGNRRWNFLIISVLLWLVLASVFISFLAIPPYNDYWPVFFLGIPAQIIILLWSGLRTRT